MREISFTGTWRVRGARDTGVMTARRRPRTRVLGLHRLARRPRLSVRSRILVSMLLVTAVGLAVSGGASYLVQRGRVLSAVDAALLHSVPELRAIADGRASATAPGSVEGILRAAMKQIIPAENESVVGFINDRPALVPAVNLPFRMDRNPALVDRIVSEAHPTKVVIGTAVTEEGTLRYLIVPIRANGDPDRGLYVVARDLTAELGAVADSFRLYIGLALLSLLLVAAVGWLVAGRLLRPIRLLREAAAGSSSASDLTERIPVTGRDDVSELAETINGMFDRLQESSLGQRRLLDDVGHELKTPITIVRGHLELLDSGSPGDVETTKALAIDELDRMANLVSEISLLAESRSPHFLHAVETDLQAFTVSVAAKASVLDPGRSWQVEWASGLALVDVRRLTQAWLQLADNAVKYSTAGAALRIASDIEEARSGRWLCLSVSDSGPGIPEQERARIFERFQRLQPSDAAGSGLGLTIVAAIAAAHGGAVQVAETGQGGSVFTIRVPLVALAAQRVRSDEQ